MKKKKIKDSKLISPLHHIRDIQPPQTDHTIHFSFKHLDMAHQKFTINKRESRYFVKLIERLKNVSALNPQEILSNRSKSLRAHPINWEDTSEKNGFKHLNKQLREITPYQFEISGNEHGRIHGFFIDNIFFIIWFDPGHRLYG